MPNCWSSPKSKRKRNFCPCLRFRSFSFVDVGFGLFPLKGSGGPVEHEYSMSLACE
jgi:hypothetical protein